ncbi:MAG: IS4 family transposase [Flavobacteriales bacterium]
MSKNALFSGQPIFSQLIKFIPRDKFSSIVRKYNGDRYTKKFDSFHHLISMLYAQFENCSSLREVEIGMLACMEKMKHLGIVHQTKRSTLSEANIRRDPKIFEELYFSILSKYRHILTDSRNALLDKRLYILDATVVTLFKDILPAAGCNPKDGKRKGGLKVHTLLSAASDLPELVVMNAAASRDGNVLKDIDLPKKSILVFDKGYVNFDQFNRFSKEEVYWVSRRTTSWVYESKKEIEVNGDLKINGVVSDKEIILGNTHNRRQTRVRARMVTYYDHKSERQFEFITNNFQMSALTIAQLYEKRWQVELVFKRIKQNSQLYNFLGDNENAIKIQVWAALIADLMTKIVLCKTGKKICYSQVATIIRLHFMSYFNLFDFLRDPQKAYKSSTQKISEYNLFSSA